MIVKVKGLLYLVLLDGLSKVEHFALHPKFIDTNSKIKSLFYILLGIL